MFSGCFFLLKILEKRAGSKHDFQILQANFLNFHGVSHRGTLVQKSLHKIPLKSLENGGPAVLKPLYVGTVFLDVQALLL